MEYARAANGSFDRTVSRPFSLNLESQGYDAKRGKEFHNQLIERLRSVGAIRIRGGRLRSALDAYSEDILFLPEGYVPTAKNENLAAGLTRVGPGYFATMGTQLVAGRAIDERDTEAAQPVAVINETLARRYWKSPELAIGRRFRTQRGGRVIEVAGVARDGKYRSFSEGATPYLFRPISQDYMGQIEVLVRSPQTLEALMPEIRREVASLDPSLAIFGARTMPQFLNRMVSLYDIGASLIGTFAIMAMLLAAVGIYGVLHFTVARRTREIGIRMALGARVSQVLIPVLRRSLLWVAAGLALGIGLAISARGFDVAIARGSERRGSSHHRGRACWILDDRLHCRVDSGATCGKSRPHRGPPARVVSDAGRQAAPAREFQLHLLVACAGERVEFRLTAGFGGMGMFAYFTIIF